MKIPLLHLFVTSIVPMGLAVVAAAQTARPASLADFDRRATAGEPLSVVFFGGSLTWGANASDPQRTSYRALMGQYLQTRYPKSSFSLHDAAIGGTGSKLGIFRLQRDVLSRKPDLVFLDFTANDDLEGKDGETLDSYETLLRELIGRGIPVVQVLLGFRYNFGPDYHPEKLTRYQDHRKLAEAYRTAVGDSFPHVQKAITDGGRKIDVLWPFDGAHPDDVGYQLFFEAVRDGFEQAVKDKRVCVVPERPVFSADYATRKRICLVDLPAPEGWRRGKTFRTSLWFDGLSSRWMDDVLVCDAKDRATARPLRVTFRGTMAGVFGEVDQDGLSFKATIDGKAVRYQENPKTAPTEVWAANTTRFGGGRLFFWRVLAEKLTGGEHVLEITPVFDEAAPKGQLRIESVCAAGNDK
jgi:lysophospholipase L1-like esterase